MSDEIKARLAAVRARKAELDAQRAAREALEEPDEQLAREERELADNEAIEKAVAAHGPVGGKIKVVHTDLGCVIVKRSNPALFRRFQDAGELKNETLDKLVRPNIVHPDLNAFDRINDELPATLLRCANAVSELAGVRTSDVAGK